MKRIYELIVTNQKGISITICDFRKEWLTKKIARPIIDSLPDDEWHVVVKGDNKVVASLFAKRGDSWLKLEQERENFDVIL